jgi:hypothetical protein
MCELLTMRSVQNVVNKYLDTADKSFREAGAAFAAFPNPAFPKYVDLALGQCETLC